MGRELSLFALGAVALLPLSVDARAQQTDMTYFIAKAPIDNGGDLGGLAGADAYCQRLASAAGAGNKTWRAYLSTNANAAGGTVNARDRIGSGPWWNARGIIIASDVDELHSKPNINKQTALDEQGNPLRIRGDSPNTIDVLTGSNPEGRAFASNLDLTCNNWTSDNFGNAMLGHLDRSPGFLECGAQVAGLFAGRVCCNRGQRTVLFRCVHRFIKDDHIAITDVCRAHAIPAKTIQSVWHYGI
jgi:hypothetical protein